MGTITHFFLSLQTAFIEMNKCGPFQFDVVCYILYNLHPRIGLKLMSGFAENTALGGLPNYLSYVDLIFTSGIARILY